MQSRHLLTGLLLLLAAGTSCAAGAPGPTLQRSKLQQLEVSAGRWVYHGHFLARHGSHSSPWTWHEDCRWSGNRVFMVCSFSNTWAGRHVDSVVVDTYDPQDRSFWHYEIFDSGRSAGKPFAARMQIDGATRIESWAGTRKGKPLQQRIVYQFVSGSKVSVRFQRSADGVHWQTTATGTGTKLPG